MGRTYHADVLDWVTSDATPVANTAAITAVFPHVPIYANQLQDGRIIRYRAFGKLSTTGTPTIKFSFYWGGLAGSLLAETEAITNGSGVANVLWSIDAYLQTRVNGTTGSVIMFGEARVHTSATAVAVNVFSVSGYDAPAAVTLDLTADSTLALGATWSAASLSNTLTGMFRLVDQPN